LNICNIKEQERILGDEELIKTKDVKKKTPRMCRKECRTINWRRIAVKHSTLNIM